MSYFFFYIFVECTLPRQSPIANRVLHKRQRKLIEDVCPVPVVHGLFCDQWSGLEVEVRLLL